MSDAPANFELSIVLPLGVIANQLRKVETDLRFLSARTAAFAGEGAREGATQQVAGRLDGINETLDAIRALMADLETQIQPRSANSKSLKARTDRDD